MPKAWEYNVLGINHPDCPKLQFMSSFIRETSGRLEGDYVEFGVFKGKTLLSIAGLISSLESSGGKNCWGYDTFSGFPQDIRKDARDSPERFEEMLAAGEITNEHYQDLKRLQSIRQMQSKRNELSPLSHQDLSTSGDFENTGAASHILETCAFLKIQNIILVEGPFSETLKCSKNIPDRIWCGLVDVDLYESYQQVLEAIWERVVKGGRLYLDEYYSLKFPGPRKFVNRFIESRRDCLLVQAGISGDFERWYLEKTWSMS